MGSHYQSPIPRRPLPSIPSQPPPSPSPYQRSLLSDIYSFTKDRDYEYYDKFSSEAENNSITRGRSRIPVALNSSKKQAKTRTANQLELLKPRLRLEKEDGEIIKKGLMWIQQDK